MDARPAEYQFVSVQGDYRSEAFATYNEAEARCALLADLRAYAGDAWVEAEDAIWADRPGCKILPLDAENEAILRRWLDEETTASQTVNQFEPLLSDTNADGAGRFVLGQFSTFWRHVRTDFQGGTYSVGIDRWGREVPSAAEQRKSGWEHPDAPR